MRKAVYLVGCLAIIAAASSWYWTTQAVEPPPVAEFQTREDAVLQSLASGSELIIAGRCVATTSQWVENGRILVTLADIEIDETLKGSSSSKVTVVLPGGSDSNRRFPVAMTYPGAPAIQEGEEVFLFLTADDLVSGGFAVNGWAEGKFSILRDDRGNRLISRSYVRGPVTSDSLAAGNQRFDSLDEFRNRVRRLAGR
jgi:hypothetical protein